MENSEIQKHSVKLGEALVEALGLRRSNDTLSRWMAHYIAEQIARAEHTSGTEQEERKECCWETVLKLQEHWIEGQQNRRPMDGPDSVATALDCLHENDSSVSLPSWLVDRLSQN